MTNHKTAASSSCFIRQSRAAAVLGFFALAWGQLCAAGPIKFIAISAATMPTYVRSLDAEGKPQPESYVFTEGKFFGGNTKDTQLTQIKFDDIIKSLAPNLAKQNYFPTQDVPSADILIMVHWGMTTVYEDPQKDFIADKMNQALSDYNAAADNGNADPGALNAALGDQAYMQGGAQGNVVRNAALLGFKSTLEKEQTKLYASTDELTMSAELNEERYFVILMAYDYQRMRKERKSQVLWITRISVRSPGNNFLEAMPALVEAGAKVYGKQVAGVVRVNAGEKGGRVDLGELKVMGTVDDPKPDEKKK